MIQRVALKASERSLRRSPFINFIAGENGSGKSALLTAISFALVRVAPNEPSCAAQPGHHGHRAQNRFVFRAHRDAFWRPHSAKTRLMLPP